MIYKRLIARAAMNVDPTVLTDAELVDLAVGKPGSVLGPRICASMVLGMARRDYVDRGLTNFMADCLAVFGVTMVEPGDDPPTDALGDPMVLAEGVDGPVDLGGLASSAGAAEARALAELAVARDRDWLAAEVEHRYG